METLETAAQVLGCLATIGAFIAGVVKVARELQQSKAGTRCLLRSEMLRIYYNHVETRQTRQYEIENFLLLYQAYKAQGGNSFIDEIHQEVTSWKIIT